MTSCPDCGAREVDAPTPMTTFGCGSQMLDQREGTFMRGPRCATVEPRAEVRIDGLDLEAVSVFNARWSLWGGLLTLSRDEAWARYRAFVEALDSRDPDAVHAAFAALQVGLVPVHRDTQLKMRVLLLRLERREALTLAAQRLLMDVERKLIAVRGALLLLIIAGAVVCWWAR